MPKPLNRTTIRHIEKKAIINIKTELLYKNTCLSHWFLSKHKFSSYTYIIIHTSNLYIKIHVYTPIFLKKPKDH